LANIKSSVVKGFRKIFSKKKLKINWETTKQSQYICRPASKSETGLVEKFFDIMQQRTGKLF
jgi:hypothetical protein